MRGQEWSEDNPDIRTEFCEIMLQLLIGDDNYLANKSSFYLN